VASNSALELII